MDTREEITGHLRNVEEQLGRSMGDKAKTYVMQYLTHGDELKAAEEAGYSDPRSAVYRLRQNQAVLLAIRADTLAVFQKGVSIAARYLIDTIKDPKAPHSARNDAAKTILNRAGIVEHKPGSGGTGETKDIADLSPAELQAAIAGMQGELEKKQAKSEPIEGQSSPATRQPKDEPLPNQ